MKKVSVEFSVSMIGASKTSELPVESNKVSVLDMLDTMHSGKFLSSVFRRVISVKQAAYILQPRRNTRMTDGYAIKEFLFYELLAECLFLTESQAKAHIRKILIQAWEIDY